MYYLFLPHRIEPLISEEFMHKRPVIIPYHRGGKRLYVVYKVRDYFLEYFVYNVSVMFFLVLISCQNRNLKKGWRRILRL